MTAKNGEMDIEDSIKNLFEQLENLKKRVDELEPMDEVSLSPSPQERSEEEKKTGEEREEETKVAKLFSERIEALKFLSHRLEAISLILSFSIVFVVLLIVVSIQNPDVREITEILNVSICFASLFILFTFEREKKQGTRLYEELGDLLEAQLRIEPFSILDSERKYFLEAKDAMRVFMKATELPFTPQKSGPFLYLCLFLVLVLFAVLIN